MPNQEILHRSQETLDSLKTKRPQREVEAFVANGNLLRNAWYQRLCPNQRRHSQRQTLLLFLCFHFLLVLFDDRTGDMRGHDIVVIELHAEVAASARNGT